MAVGIYIYDTDVVLNGAGDKQPLRFAIGGTYNHPSASGPYLDLGIAEGDATSFTATQTIYQDRLGFGFGSIDGGVLQCVAPDTGEYDFLRNVGFGQPARLRYGAPNADISTFFRVFDGIASNAEVSQDVFRIGWQDGSKLLDTPMSEREFEGTNTGTTGYEGLTTDIKGQRKPRAWGRVPDIQPILLNAPLRVYGWNYTRSGVPAQSLAVNAVRVRGFVWSNVGDYPNAAALAALALTTGQYATCLAESKLRMGGSSPIDGSVRIDALISNDKAPTILNNMLLDAGVAGDNISTSDIALLSASRNFDVGFYTQDASTREAMNELLLSILAWCSIDTTGVYRFGTVPTVTDNSVVRSIRKLGLSSVGDENTLTLVSLQPEVNVETKNVPAKTVRVAYFYRPDPPSKDNLASGLSDADKQSLSQEYRYTNKLMNNETAVLYDNADEVEWRTRLVQEGDANAIRDALLAIIGKRQHRYTAQIFAEQSGFEGLRVGSCINLFHKRFGLQNGKQMFITSVALDVRSGFLSLGLLEIGDV